MTTKQNLSSKWILRGLSIICFLSAWEIIGGRINPVFLSKPTAITSAFFEMLLSGQLISAVLVSLGVTAIGFSGGIVVGVPVGVLMGRIRVVEYLIDSYVNALYVVPRIALIPLIIVWFGLGIQAQLVVVFLTSVFPILINTYMGVRNVSMNLVETARSFGASEFQVFTKIILPSSIPFMMAGLRLGIGQAVIGMVVAQMFLGMAGMGFILVKYGDLFATSHVFVVVIVLAGLGILLTELIRFLERRFTHWKEGERAFI